MNEGSHCTSNYMVPGEPAGDVYALLASIIHTHMPKDESLHWKGPPSGLISIHHTMRFVL